MTEYWHIVSFQTEKEQSETICNWLREQWDIEPIELAKPMVPLVWIECYFTELPRALLASHVIPQHFDVKGLHVRGCGEKDWQDFWKHHFKINNIGKKLQIVPVWNQESADPQRIPIVLNPGLSFGTGDHFTTRFCLEQLDEIFAIRPVESLLDVGTGSGILATAAVKMGCRKVDAFDYDEVCLKYAAENLEINGVRKDITLFEHDLTAPWTRGSYDVVCANVFANLLMLCADQLRSMTRNRLIMTGILERDADAVAQSFIHRGGREVVRDGDGEWCGIVMDF